MASTCTVCLGQDYTDLLITDHLSCHLQLRLKVLSTCLELKEKLALKVNVLAWKLEADQSHVTDSNQ